MVWGGGVGSSYVSMGINVKPVVNMQPLDGLEQGFTTCGTRTPLGRGHSKLF